MHVVLNHAHGLVVHNGIDKHVFTAQARAAARAPGEPLRVLVEGLPTLAFKRVDAAVDAIRAMDEAARLTVCAAEADAAAVADADVTLGGLDAADMAGLYRDNHVLVKLSTVEGSPLPPVEAAHVGLPTVLTPHTGHEEFAVH